MANEQRLIDANLVKSAVREVMAENRSEELFIKVAEQICKMLDHAPPVDAIEVVWCKDCKHFDENNACYCHAADENGTPIFVREHDFCSYGERRENNE